MFDRYLNGENPYRFDDGEDWSHEIPPLELCQYLPAWDIRIVGADDLRYDYGDVSAEDDGRFNYTDEDDWEWKPTPDQLNVDGGDVDEGDNPDPSSDDYDLNTMTDPDANPYEYLIRNIDGGDADEQEKDADDRAFEWEDESDTSYIVPETLVDFDGNEDSEEVFDYDFNELSKVDSDDKYTEDIDFCTLIYNMPEEYANIYSVTVYCIARILEDEIIKQTGDWLAKYEIHPHDFPEADAYMNIHVGINPRMNKVYVEYLENPRLKVLMGDKRKRLDKTIADQLNNFFRMTKRFHGYNVEIIMPEDNYTYCCDSIQVASCHTVSYWKSFVGKYTFLEDREEVKLDIAKRGYDYDRMVFYNKVHDLNKEYSMCDCRHYMIPEVFEKYKQIYKDEFGVDLPNFYEAYIQVACKYDVLYRDGMYGKTYEADIKEEDNVA